MMLRQLLVVFVSLLMVRAVAGSADSYQVGSDGFIRHWLVCGGFPNPGGAPFHKPRQSLGFDVDFLAGVGGEANIHPYPGAQVDAIFPKTTEDYWVFGDQRRVRQTWQKLTTNAADGYVDLLGPSEPSGYVCSYAYCILRSPIQRTARLLAGSDDGIKIWLNGQVVLAQNVFRSAKPGQNEAAVAFKPGDNPLLIKVSNDQGGFGFYLQLLDEQGQPLSTVTVVLPDKPQLPEPVDTVVLGKDLSAAHSMHDHSFEVIGNHHFYALQEDSLHLSSEERHQPGMQATPDDRHTSTMGQFIMEFPDGQAGLTIDFDQRTKYAYGSWYQSWLDVFVDREKIGTIPPLAIPDEAQTIARHGIWLLPIEVSAGEHQVSILGHNGANVRQVTVYPEAAEQLRMAPSSLRPLLERQVACSERPARALTRPISKSFQAEPGQRYLLTATIIDADNFGARLLARINEIDLLPFYTVGYGNDGRRLDQHAYWVLAPQWLEEDNTVVLQPGEEGWVVVGDVDVQPLDGPAPQVENSPAFPDFGFGNSIFLPDNPEDTNSPTIQAWQGLSMMPGGWARSDVYWLPHKPGVLQPKAGQWTEGAEYAHVKGTFENMKRGAKWYYDHGIQILLIFQTWGSPPLWARRPDTGHAKMPAYRALVRKVGEAVGKYVDWYEPFNEPSFAKAVDPDTVADILNTSYRTAPYTFAELRDFIRATDEELAAADRWDADGDGQNAGVLPLAYGTEGNSIYNPIAGVTPLLADSIILHHSHGISFHNYRSIPSIMFEAKFLNEAIAEAEGRTKRWPQREVWMTETGMQGQDDGRRSKYTWESQYSYFRNLERALLAHPGVLDHINVFTLRSDNWGMVWWGPYAGREDRNYIRLTKAGNLIMRPIGVKYVLTGQPVEARMINSEEGSQAVVKAVRAWGNRLLVAATNPTKQRLRFGVALPIHRGEVKKLYCYEIDSTIGEGSFAQHNDSLLVRFDLPPGRTMQYVVDLTEAAANKLFPSSIQ